MWEVTKYGMWMVPPGTGRPIVISQRIYRWRWLAEVAAVLIPMSDGVFVYWSNIKPKLKLVKP